jgi:hypothetical protein
MALRVLLLLLKTQPLLLCVEEAAVATFNFPSPSAWDYRHDMTLHVNLSRRGQRPAPKLDKTGTHEMAKEGGKQTECLIET